MHVVSLFLRKLVKATYLQNSPAQAAACCLYVSCYTRLKPKMAKGKLGGDLLIKELFAKLSVIALVTQGFNLILMSPIVC